MIKLIKKVKGGNTSKKYNSVNWFVLFVFGLFVITIQIIGIEVIYNYNEGSIKCSNCFV